MKGITWARDSHGLFDYESRHLSKSTMKTNQASTLRRVNNEIEILPLGQGAFQFPPATETNPEQETKQLLNVINENGKFINVLKFIEQFYIESVVGMLAGQGGVVGDGSNSPTNYKEIAMLERGNITSMSK